MSLDFSPLLNKWAKRIRTDIVNRVVRGVQLNGKPYTPNAESTEKKKGFNRRLIAKGKTFVNARTYNIKSATKSNQKATIYLEDDVAEIGMYNQAPTGAGKIKPKDKVVFYGVSEDSEKDGLKDIDKYINDQTDKEIEKWGFKKV